MQVAVERVDGVVGTPLDDVLELVSQMGEHGASLRSLEVALKISCGMLMTGSTIP